MDFEKLLNLLDKAIEKSAKKLNAKLLELLENGGDINTAFASFSDNFWADFLKAYNKANGAQLSLDELMNLRADKITLSKALYTGLKQSKNSVKSVIKTAIKEQKSANELAKMLYEGYDFKNDPLKVKTKYPKYLWEKSAKTKVKNIKTPALRTAYSKILKDESKLVANKALKIAGYEKARYYAKRIALNETARAYNDARAFEYANSDDIQVVKIQMSITHPRTDICDYYAGVDKYGLGAGVYPKDKAPVPPFHPFCRCQMIPRYADEYAKPKLNAKADKEYLLGLKEWQRARILGSKAKANEALKTGDINGVFNAMKPERYKVKSINEVAKYQKQNSTTQPLKQANKVKEYNLINATKEEITEKIQNGFSTKQREFYVLGKTSIFGSEKRLILSSDTIQSHMHHQDIAAADYAKIIDISKNIKYILAQSNIVYILLGTSNNKNYMLTLKNIANKDEIFAVSLLKLSKNNGIDKEYKRLSKKYKTVE
ncbi:MAG: hypothetical protein MR769_04615 [Campylobacter sp.]|uniref:hypothetical protein n=1 Tax=Campylobacter sp. TaxID=205 RepID=UPI002AA6BDE6|nr:hypothetical protein [Campylobacter sp.]MCI6343949.1 hypothetical protein [Campylobacter sp.]